MELGLCLAAYGGAGLRRALEETAAWDRLCLDLPTDTTLELVDARRCLDDCRYLDELADTLASAAKAGRPVTCVSNSRDAQLLLGPYGVHTDPVLTGSVEEKREHATRCALGAVRLAERIAAPAVRLLVGCPDFALWLSWWGSEVGWEDNVNELFVWGEPVLRAASDAGVRVLLEPHPKQIVYDRTSVDLVFSAAGHWESVLGLCIDPANMAAMGYNAVGAVAGWGRRMVAVHAKDLQQWSALTGDTEPPGAGWCRYGPQPPIRFRALGFGTINWPAVVARLVDEGFDGILYVEHEDASLARDDSIRRSLTLLRSLVPRGSAEGRTW